MPCDFFSELPILLLSYKTTCTVGSLHCLKFHFEKIKYLWLSGLWKKTAILQIQIELGTTSTCHLLSIVGCLTLWNVRLCFHLRFSCWSWWLFTQLKAKTPTEMWQGLKEHHPIHATGGSQIFLRETNFYFLQLIDNHVKESNVSPVWIKRMGAANIIPGEHAGPLTEVDLPGALIEICDVDEARPDTIRPQMGYPSLGHGNTRWIKMLQVQQ